MAVLGGVGLPVLRDIYNNEDVWAWSSPSQQHQQSRVGDTELRGIWPLPTCWSPNIGSSLPPVTNQDAAIPVNDSLQRWLEQCCADDRASYGTTTSTSDRPDSPRSTSVSDTNSNHELNTTSPFADG